MHSIDKMISISNPGFITIFECFICLSFIYSRYTYVLIERMIERRGLLCAGTPVTELAQTSPR